MKDGDEAKQETEGDHIAALALLITSMRYGELIVFSEALHSMVFPDGEDEPMFWDLKNPYEWAQMLHSWAECNLPEGGV